jgi:hypothetical protein
VNVELTFEDHKRRKFSGIAEQLSASRGGLCSMELLVPATGY